MIMLGAGAKKCAAVTAAALLTTSVAAQENGTTSAAAVTVAQASTAPQPSATTKATAPVVTAPSPAPSIKYAPQVVAPGTPIRLMFLKEINSRNAVPGQQFKMRVNEPVFMNGQAVIPVGITAWGEVVSFDSSGAVGKGGKLGIRMLYLDLPEGRFPLKGEANQRGSGNGAGLALAIVGFGIFGLFSAGDSARFKGGDQLTVFADLVPVESLKPVTASDAVASTPSVAAP